MKRILITTIAIIIYLHCFSQNNSIIPPSPNAQGMAEYANIPVSLFTGTPQVNVPLYTIRTNDFALDISLNYHASGIKVQDVAGSTGLGWSLQAGGAVTRTVRGIPDEEPDGYCGINKRINFLYTEEDEKNYNVQALKNIGENKWDGEPDVFYFNIGNYTGRFFLDIDGNVVQVPQQMLNITPAIGPQGIGYWIFKDYDGNTFKVGERTTETTESTIKINDEDKTTIFISTWYLDEITTVNNNSISFRYAVGQPTEIIYYATSKTVELERTALKSSCRDLASDNVKQNNMNIKIVDPKYIASISSVNTNIKFTGSYDRIDLINGHKIEAITINEILGDNSLNEFFRYQLKYDYFKSSILGGSYTNSRWLKLTEIRRIGNIYTEAYRSFDYFDEDPYNSLRRDILDIDHWGYKNGHIENRLHDVPRYIYDGEVISGGYRENMSPDLLKSFALKKIFYPSGGYRELVFEPHEVYVNNIKKDVGGIRISKIINYDGISSSEVEYDYHNSGQLYSEDPDYGHIYHNIIDNSQCSYKTLIRYSHPLNNLFDLNGYHIGYSKVSEIKVGGGSKEYLFNNFSEYPDSQSRKYLYSYYCYPLPQGACYPFLNRSDLGYNSLPFTANTFKGWGVGSLRSESIFNSNIIEPVNEIKSLYNNILVEDVKIPALASNIMVYGGEDYYWFAISRYDILTGYINLKESESIERIENKELSQRSYYSYNDKLQINSVKNIDTNGIFYTKYKYAHEYNLSHLIDIGNKNLFSYVIEEQIWKSNSDENNLKLINSTVTDFQKTSSNLLLPKYIYDLSTENSITSNELGEDYDYFGSYNNLFPINQFNLQSEFKYDDKGNVIEVKTKDGLSTSYIYGHRKYFPVAQIIGATYDQVENYLSSFSGRYGLPEDVINNLISNLPNAHISTYTYDPLYGMTSETGPDNIKLTYEYDDFGRLKLVKDHNGDILKRYTYQYRVQ